MLKQELQQQLFGLTAVAHVRDAVELRRALNDPWLEAETIIIKPNWVSSEPADFNDAHSMRLLFEALGDRRYIVTESHNVLRHEDEGLPFAVGGKEVNWRWLGYGDGWNWLIENGDFDWFINGGHWERIQEDEQIFLDRQGFSDLFREFDVTYVNISDEIWSGRAADSASVRKAVDARFAPLQFEPLLGMVPQLFFDLRGATFISLAKFKSYASFTYKNMFGLIADPLQPYWHGPNSEKIPTSILDINKIYHALFNVYGICEALSDTAVVQPDGEHKGLYTPRYDVVDAPGIIVHGRNLVELDTLLLRLCEDDLLVVDEVNRAPLELAAVEFSTVDRQVLDEAKETLGSWDTMRSRDP